MMYSNHKKVLVIGGGPAGMQAAITAAERGHRVVLLEKEAELGGRLGLSGSDNLASDGLKACNWAADSCEWVRPEELADQAGPTAEVEQVIRESRNNFRNYLVRRTDTLAIDVRLNTEATPELAASLAPDVIIVAVGAKAKRAEAYRSIAPDFWYIGDCHEAGSTHNALRNGHDAACML